ncbi:tetratricopeptide repeat protein [Leptothoe sp. PORK10 BA2]|uniref:tetratricopeptide repeat protein n=1 Tax=Leptothoe sp. PORK10 BA2 TaxID=3110254 RepID=UPI002B20D326|nr:tetratricopeptide repeat protein [Leptothoe sp. PORK10 BA2]MEA5463831.1 tetratricopeptide repeat protein [Leptothoe sp. PORK10 BA2]
MRIFHIDLKPKDDQHIALRYGWENLSDFAERILPMSEISDLIARAERDYYVQLLPDDYGITGQRLYQWLDGSDRWLAGQLSNEPDLTVLAIAAAGRLAHLPWEVLHDGQEFLVAKLARAVVPVRWSGTGTQPLTVAEAEPANRALNVLFMATSPTGVEPELDFEAEEGRILTATKRQPLALTVEESGCLEELQNLVASHDRGWFDVLHLTGHAGHTDDGPIFITETELGQRRDATAQDIAKAVQFRFPAVVFLSGCRTGQSGKAGTVPSMAAQLLGHGAGAVLGWGQPVLDQDGTTAAAALYGGLAAAKSLPEALALTYQAMLEAKARDWHLLRLYVAAAIPGALVTPMRTQGRKKAPKPSVVSVFLDQDGVGRAVAGRESFVGRRRELQACLRALMPYGEEEALGVLLHGMGGNGKSTLALRLCDRLTGYEKVVWIGPVDENGLVNRLADQVKGADLQQRLRQTDEPLKYRLEAVFGQLETPLLLVLDDFEQNLETENPQRLKPGIADLLKAMLWAIEQTDSDHRLLITCRYEFEFSGLSQIYRQPLATFKGANLEKKCSRLAAFQPGSGVDGVLQTKAKELSDGNPRLLEWLSKVLVDQRTDTEAILAAMAEKTEEFRENILAETLLGQQSAEMREFLSRGLVYELPVPREAMLAVGDGERHIERAVALGLMERTTEDSLRVPRVLPLEVPESKELAGLAAKELYRLWWQEAEGSSEVQRLEIHRLAMVGEEGEIVVEIANRLAGQFRVKSRYQEAVNLCQKSLQVTTSYKLSHELATSAREIGEVDLALTFFDQALETCPDDDELLKAAIFHESAILKAGQGDVEGAIALYQQSLAIKEKIGDAQGKAATLHQMAILKANQGDVEGAIALYQQSLAITEKIGDVKTKAATLHEMAILKANQGDVEGAIALFQQSFFITEKIGNEKGKAATLHQMGRLKANQGDVEGAIALYQQSLDIEEKIGNVQGKASTLHQMAILKANQGDVEGAISLYQQSLDIKEKIGDEQGKAATLHQMASLKADQGDVEGAIALFQQSLNITEKIGDVQTKAATLWWLGQLFAEQKQEPTTGLTYLHQALTIYQQIRSPKADSLEQTIRRIENNLP